MSTVWAEVLGRQAVAAIEMLRKAIDASPEDLWDDRLNGTPFWHLAYHVLP